MIPHVLVFLLLWSSHSPLARNAPAGLRDESVPFQSQQSPTRSKVESVNLNLEVWKSTISLQRGRLPSTQEASDLTDTMGASEPVVTARSVSEVWRYNRKQPLLSDSGELLGGFCVGTVRGLEQCSACKCVCVCKRAHTW